MEYQALNVPLSEIRVITILAPVSGSRLVHCTMETVSLLDKKTSFQNFEASYSTIERRQRKHLPSWAALQSASGLLPSESLGPVPTIQQFRFRWGDYAALSYTWGDPHETARIVLNGYTVQVRSNLEAALRVLSDVGWFAEGYRVWIDALCINQNDKQEQGRQVSGMRNLYDGSWTVVTWLGKASGDSDKAITLLENLASYEQDGPESFVLGERLLSKPDLLGLGSWLALHEFLQRPYWSRLWVIQEIALGPFDLPMFCGTRQITWRKVYLGVAMIHQALWYVKNSCIANDRKALGMSGKDLGIWQTDNLHHMSKNLGRICKQEANGGENLSFEYFLRVAHAASCFDPRDKIYGLLGVMEPSMSKHIVVNYNLEAGHVFADIARQHIMQSRSIEILKEGRHWQNNLTPSWAPDWTSQCGDWENQPHYPYCAGTDREPEFSFSEDGMKIVCKGVILDVIDGLGSREVEEEKTSPWSEVIQPENFTSAYGNKLETRQALFLALVGGRIGRTKGPANDPNLSILNLPQNAEVAMKEFQRCAWNKFAIQGPVYAQWQDWRSSNKDLSLGYCSLGEFFGETIPEGAVEDDYWDAYLRWRRTWSGRRFMLTKGGYMGWTVDCAGGSAIQQPRKGDIICIIFGCSTPLTLRPSDDCEHFRIIGESYVQGLMEGEISQVLCNGKYIVQGISII